MDDVSPSRALRISITDSTEPEPAWNQGEQGKREKSKKVKVEKGKKGKREKVKEGKRG